MNYSQHNEQEIILNFFNGRIGRYLDIGAFDGVSMSNTLALAELGWQGTAIEPSPWVFNRLKSNYQAKGILDRVQLIESALVIDDYPDQIKFYETHKSDDREPGSGVGSMSFEHIDKWTKTYKESGAVEVQLIEYNINTIKINEIFKNDVYDFISIDVEDFNFELINAIPWKKLKKLKLFCVEADLPWHRFVNFMKPLGWKLYQKESYNLFFVRD